MDHDIQIYKTDDFNIPENDSVMKMMMLKNNLYDNYNNGLLTMHYHRTLNPDSLVFLGAYYGEKSKTELIDSNRTIFNRSLIIVSKSDTIMFSQKEIIQKINEVWAKRNANPSIKLKAREKNQLIWEFRNDSLTE